MKLQQTERVRRERTSDVVRGLAEPERSPTAISDKDRGQILAELEAFRPADWKKRQVWGWLRLFEMFSELFPDQANKLNNSPEEWAEILLAWKEAIPSNSLGQRIWALLFLQANFPEHKQDFLIEESELEALVKSIERSIAKASPAGVATWALELLCIIKRQKPDLFDQLKSKYLHEFSNGIPQELLRGPNHLARYLKKLRIALPEVFETLDVTEAVEKIKIWLATKSPLPNTIHDVYTVDDFLETAYALRVITADQVDMNPDGKVVIYTKQKPTFIKSPALPHRLVV